MAPPKKAKASKATSGGEEEDEFLTGSSGPWTDSLYVLRGIRWLVEEISTSFAGKKVNGKKKAKVEKETEEEKLPITEQVWNFACMYKVPVGLSIMVVLTSLLIIGGEPPKFGDSDQFGRREKADDYYGTLGVVRDADTGEVKRAYKTLAKRWHPDRNPNCTTCQDTFAKIAVAYETLVDDEKRAAYDETGGVASADLKSPKSVPLDKGNFDELVTYSNDVWIVQVFRPDDSRCAQFHPFWENQIQKHGHLVRFGRIDITNDQTAKWLPVKIRVLPMVLKFARHLAAPDIFPITAMHETPQQLLKFVLMSFPNIGLPLSSEKMALKSWVEGASRQHKVLFVVPGQSKDERYKSLLVPRMLASKWSELFEIRTAEAATVRTLSDAALPSEIKATLIPDSEAQSKGQIFFFAANGDPTPKVSASFDWPPTSEDEILLHLLQLAEFTTPTLSAHNAELLCRSLAAKRVYCLVMMDPSDTAVVKAVKELKDSQAQYQSEVKEIRENGGEVTEDEDNFMVATVKLLRQPRGLQPSLASCIAPQFSKIDTLLDGANAMLMDLDTNRAVALKGITSFRGIYPMIAYEEELKWEEDVINPFLSLPDCSEPILQHQMRKLRGTSILELVVQLVTLLLLLEAIVRAIYEKSVRWALGAGMVLLLILLRSPPFLRWGAAIVPAKFVAPTLVSAA